MAPTPPPCVVLVVLVVFAVIAMMVEIRKQEIAFQGEWGKLPKIYANGIAGPIAVHLRFILKNFNNESIKYLYSFISRPGYHSRRRKNILHPSLMNLMAQPEFDRSPASPFDSSRQSHAGSPIDRKFLRPTVVNRLN